MTEGHPDKIADQISDAVLDAILADDPTAASPARRSSRRALAFVRRDHDQDYVDIPRIVRDTIKEIGYTDAAYGFDYETCGVLNAIQGSLPTSRWASTRRRTTSRGRATRADVRLRDQREPRADAARS